MTSLNWWKVSARQTRGIRPNLDQPAVRREAPAQPVASPPLMILRFFASTRARHVRAILPSACARFSLSKIIHAANGKMARLRYYQAIRKDNPLSDFPINLPPADGTGFQQRATSRREAAAARLGTFRFGRRRGPRAELAGDVSAPVRVDARPRAADGRARCGGGL